MLQLLVSASKQSCFPQKSKTLALAGLADQKHMKRHASRALSFFDRLIVAKGQEPSALPHI